jgi:hypothetical protein
VTELGEEEEERKRMELQQESKWKRLLKYDDPKKFYWDQVILIIAIYNCVFIPLTLCFQEINILMSKQVWHTVINLGSTFFFILDIFLEFNTTYVSSTGEEIKDRSKIAKNYL